MHDHAPRGSATLPGGADSTEEDRLRRHVDIGAGGDDQRIVATEFHDRSAKPAMDCLGNMEPHLDRACGRDQGDTPVSRQFLSNSLAVADEQSKDCRVGAGFATDALGDFGDRNRGKRSFFRWLPGRGITANRGECGVPRPNRDRKIERRDHRDDAERMPLLHQAMIFSLRLNGEPVKHTRLTDCEITNVDHLLHLTFAFGDDLAGLQCHELAELAFKIAESVPELPHRFTTQRCRRYTPR